MVSLDYFDIAFKSLEIGNHTFEYVLNNDFFTAIESSVLNEGALNAVVTVKKNETNAELEIQIDGTIQIPCDRCLDDMTQIITVKEFLLVKFGHTTEDIEDSVIIEENSGLLNIAWHLYEFIVLAIPIMHMHNDGECNQAMMEKYNEYVVQHIDEKEVNSENDDVANESERTDPRWDALKNISNNN